MNSKAPSRSSHHRLAGLFEPKGVVLVGLSEKGFWGYLIRRLLDSLDFAGEVFAVNPSGKDVWGINGYTSCAAIGEKVDVAFLMVGQHLVLDLLGEIAEAGIRNVVVLASGYAEVGPQGKALQDELVERAHALGLTIWGPNSIGFVNVSLKTAVSSIQATTPLLRPSVAIITQSGSSAVEINDFAHSQNIGASFIAATGNEAMVRIADLVDYLVDHKDTKAIAIFCESIRDPVGFIRAAERARQAGKPIVILKIGRSSLAGTIAKDHTGAIVGDDRVFSAVCERLGIVRVSSVEDLVVTAGLMAATGPLEAPGMCFVSTSGGTCTLVADGAEEAGVTLPEFTAELKEKLRGVLPAFASTNNPLDITGAWMNDPELIEKVIPHMAAQPGVGIVAAHFLLPTMEGEGYPAGLPPLGRVLSAIDKPAIVCTTAIRSFTQFSRDTVAEHGLPHIICGIEPMLHAVSRLAWWSQQAVRRPALPAIVEGTRANGTVIRGERALLDHLAAAGVPVIPGETATTRDDAERIAASAEGSLALKVASPEIAHKTEIGGIRLEVAPDEAGAAFDSILAEVGAARPDAPIEGVIISPMRRQGIELLVNVRRDPHWGPMLSVGLGGVLVEVMADLVTAPLPVTRNQVKAMLTRLRGAKLLDGYRGAKTIGLDAIADGVAAIAEAAGAMGDNLLSLEVNPLLVGKTGVEALDALASWRE